MRAAKFLNPGQTSDIIEDSGALWILKLIQKEAPRKKTFEELRKKAENFVGNLKAQALLETISEEKLAGLNLRWTTPPDPTNR